MIILEMFGFLTSLHNVSIFLQFPGSNRNSNFQQAARLYKILFWTSNSSIYDTLVKHKVVTKNGNSWKDKFTSFRVFDYSFCMNVSHIFQLVAAMYKLLCASYFSLKKEKF